MTPLVWLTMKANASAVANWQGIMRSPSFSRSSSSQTMRNLPALRSTIASGMVEKQEAMELNEGCLLRCRSTSLAKGWVVPRVVCCGAGRLHLRWWLGGEDVVVVGMGDSVGVRAF
jgi:hypothetical protein